MTTPRRVLLDIDLGHVSGIIAGGAGGAILTALVGAIKNKAAA